MKTHFNRRRLRNLAISAAFILLFQFTVIGCSHGSSSQQPPDPNSLGGQGLGGLGNPGGPSNFGGGGPNLPQPSPPPVNPQEQYCLTQNSALSTGFGGSGMGYQNGSTGSGTTPIYNGTGSTGGGTGGSTYNYNNSGGLNGGLSAHENYDPTLGGSLNPTPAPTMTPYGGSTSTTGVNPLACYNGNSGFDPNSIYTAGLQSLQYMGQCFQQVAQMGPSPNADPSSVDQAFFNARTQLVNCYQQILLQTMAFAPWANQQQQVMNSQNQSLYLLLAILTAQQHH